MEPVGTHAYDRQELSVAQCGDRLSCSTPEVMSFSSPRIASEPTYLERNQPEVQEIAEVLRAHLAGRISRYGAGP
jgi:hypothetical protein